MKWLAFAFIPWILAGVLLGYAVDTPPLDSRVSTLEQRVTQLEQDIKAIKELLDPATGLDERIKLRKKK